MPNLSKLKRSKDKYNGNEINQIHESKKSRSKSKKKSWSSDEEEINAIDVRV